MKKTRDLVVTITCVLLFAVLAVAAFFYKGSEYSNSERRKLATFPQASAQTVFSGKFMKGADEYATDHFPLRDGFRTLKAIVQFDVLRQKDNNGIYLSGGYAAKMEYPLSESSVKHATDRLQAIYEQYLQGQNGRILFAVVPDKGYFLSEKGGYPSMDYARLLAMVQENTSFATFVDITDSLSIENYYKTDTHWRQETLMPTAKKIAEALGTELTEKRETFAFDVPFYGVYCGQAALPMQAETMYGVSNAAIRNATVFNFETGKTTGIYDEEKLRGKDPYEVYLSGAAALLTVTNPAGSGKKLVVFRDSFASSFVPLLTECYSQITLIDTRYIAPALLEELVDFRDSDVLFLYSTLILNSSYTLK